MGQIILLNEQESYQYELPPMPKETDIWYHDLPKSEQYWRTPSNKDFRWLDQNGRIKNVTRMSEKDRIEYINYWRNVWTDGLWVMINGEPTYLTGMHVDHLIFNQIKNTPFYYLDAQRERFYFREMTRYDKRCLGRLWAKGRRVGITAEQITENINVMIDDFGNHTAVQSDTEKKAKSTLLSKIIETYIKRPSWMREDYYSSNGKIPRASLELISNIVCEDGDSPLGGSCRAFPSTPAALDGEEFMLVTMDELSKWIEASPYETYEINKKTVTNPGKRGKLDLLSTTGDSEAAIKSTRDWHKLIADSNPKVRNANGETNSGLYLFFVSYIHSLELLEKHPQIKDKFGKINRAMAEEFIWNEINKYSKNSKPYTYALYKMPMEIRHTLLTAAGQGYFSKIRITHRLEQLQTMANDKKPYVRGILEEDPDTGKVFFISDAERQAQMGPDAIIEPGLWLVAAQPYFSVERDIDLRNRFVYENGIYRPPINCEGCIGYDPPRYNKSDTKSNRLSRAAIIAYKKFDYFETGISNCYTMLYLGRLDDSEDNHREAVKCCKYTGFKIMIERQVESVKKVFEEEGMLQFMLKGDDGHYGLWTDSAGKIVKNGLDMLISRFSPPKIEGQPDQYDIHPFEDTLVDLDNVDLSNTTPLDAFMAMVMLEHGLKQIIFTNLTENSVYDKMQWLQELLPPR